MPFAEERRRWYALCSGTTEPGTGTGAVLLRKAEHDNAVAGDARRGVTVAEAAEVGLLPEIADRDLPTRQAHVGELDGNAGGAPVSIEERDCTHVAASESLRPDLKTGLRSRNHLGLIAERI